MAGFDPSPIRRLVELICTDPNLALQTEDGRIVRPTQPPAFESLPHPDKVCQAAVLVVELVAAAVATTAAATATAVATLEVEATAGAPFYVSLCDVAVAGAELAAAAFAGA